jgi:hypothetical protein
LILGPVDPTTNDRPLLNGNLRDVILSSAADDSLIEAFPYTPKPYADLSITAEGMNEHKSLVVFCENEDDEEQNEIIAMIRNVATEYSPRGYKFFYATKPGGMVGFARKAIRMDNKIDTVIMAVIDIPDRGGYYLCDDLSDGVLTEDKIKQFLDNPGDRKQMV